MTILFDTQSANFDYLAYSSIWFFLYDTKFDCQWSTLCQVLFVVYIQGCGGPNELAVLEGNKSPDQ